MKKTLLELPLLGSEQGGRPLVPQPGEEEVSCENMDFDHLRWLGSRRAVWSLYRLQTQELLSDL
ncbi:hypothetical protein T12_6317 [Trichinella patagoniensis]|uniref:Uncharacterized protein n=1 Tax=Trichinella patagoniensis TaxID=990121 RepID=A0A0V0Z0A2_9BILA|nr:hypothetical protein T12_6317 [Trichinella patagoniensis]